MRNYFPKRSSGAPLHTLSKLYDVPVGFETPPPYFEAVYYFICGRQRVAFARYRMICLVLIDKFNDTSRYLDDIFTIDNPAFAEHVNDIYQRELKLNKANTSDKETSFLDVNIKVIGNNIHTSIYEKRNDFDFLSVISPG